MQELERLEAAAALPPISEVLKDRFSKYNEQMQPTHDANGAELDAKVRDMWQCVSPKHYTCS